MLTVRGQKDFSFHVFSMLFSLSYITMLAIQILLG